ncbi:MAG: phosphoheptose isomerase [Dechloromonas sp.]|nr:phosphoheptose isomerase [Dechloromonas sp.]
MDLIARVSRHFEESAQTQLNAVELLAAPIAAAIETLTQCLLNGGKILACGNGGSAADAQRFAARLIGRFEADRQELAAIALNTDGALLSAVGAEFGFPQIFARQVRAFGHAGDVLLAISATGEAANVAEAILAAQEHDMTVVALTGGHGGQIGEMLGDNDIHLCVPADRPARIQETHLLVIHCLCDGIDALLLGVE